AAPAMAGEALAGASGAQRRRAHGGDGTGPVAAAAGGVDGDLHPADAADGLLRGAAVHGGAARDSGRPVMAVARRRPTAIRRDWWAKTLAGLLLGLGLALAGSGLFAFL